jgi:hypothetical protein
MPVIARELEEAEANKRYATGCRLEQRIVFFCLLQSEAAPTPKARRITDVDHLEKTAQNKKNGAPETQQELISSHSLGFLLSRRLYFFFGRGLIASSQFDPVVLDLGGACDFL